MAKNTFNVGRDVSLVFIGAFGRIDMPLVVSWDAKPITKKVEVRPLNRSPLMRYLPGGWNFTFGIERASVNPDSYQALKDLLFWSGGSVPLETLYAYIQEINGSQSIWQFQDVVSELQNAGTWKQENAVTQTVEGFASQRIQVQ